MAVNLRAFVSVGEVVIAFGRETVAAIPMTEDQRYRITNTGESEDEVAAEIAARWLSDRLV